jgi:hypothetical protein
VQSKGQFEKDQPQTMEEQPQKEPWRDPPGPPASYNRRGRQKGRLNDKQFLDRIRAIIAGIQLLGGRMALVGEWWNELGSKMVIDPPGADPRIITGTYHTAVGTAQQRDYKLAGACDAAGGPSQTVGWSVAFDPPDPPAQGEPPNAPSTCSWSGQLWTVGAGAGAMEFIETSWYLTSAMDSADDWASTHSGKDYFFRAKPTPEMLGLAILH